MSYFIRRAFRFAAQKVASDPRAREKAGEYVRFFSEEAKTIYREEDRARAAGRSVRRLWNQIQGDGDGGDKAPSGEQERKPGPEVLPPEKDDR